MTSLLKALQLMDALPGNDRSAPRSPQSSRPTSLELDLKFKMAQDTGRPATPTSSTDDESSSASLDAEDDIIRRKLAMRAYHLPENSFRQDLGTYLGNNHLIFGMCCHHRLHPVKGRQRLVILLGSLAFGLSATNAVFLYYLWGGGGAAYDDTALSLSLGGAVVENTTGKMLTVDISHGMMWLWTAGAAAHSFFDLTLWHMIACGHMQRKCCRIIGWNLAVALVMILVAATSFVVVVRAYESGKDAVGDEDTVGQSFQFGDGRADFQYLYGYLVELVLSLMVYSIFAQIVLFSGILGCGAIPFLGGRPYEVRKNKRKEEQSERDDEEKAVQSV